MTTIAYRDGVLAADSLGTDGGIKYRNETKLHRVRGAIIGIAGCTETGHLFLDWYRDGAKPLKISELLSTGSDTDFDALILNRSGLWLAHGYFRMMRVNELFVAIGSGAMAALAAMHCGKSAVDAVRIAARVDVHTGSSIRHMRLED